MKKINFKLLILTSILILLPMLVGVILWQNLPATLPSHFDLEGRSNGFSSKPMVVFAIPLLMLALHLFAILVTSLDPKSHNVASKVKHLIYWIIPVTSGMVQLSVYGSVLGFMNNVTQIGLVFIGTLFLVLGNYLPKTKQNYTVGIRLPWTLDNEENWNRTHRLAGKLWVIGGLLILFNVFLRWEMLYVLVGLLLLMVLVPTFYSYWLSRAD